ncbi:hypothetical protein D1007_51046 [Hordeum vulgare]|nr:hypothetical protein D1007_51046 [Hordeum vulgare]
MPPTFPTTARPHHRAAATMVFEDESSDAQSSLLYMHSSTSSTDGLYKVPVSVGDPDYEGLELDLMVFCEKHGKASKRHVAFEGTDTGRRFLACAEPEGDNFGFVKWVDHQWSITMHNALLKLWEMFEDAKNARVTDNLESALTIHHLTGERNTLDANYDKSEVVADMKEHMAKKYAHHQHLNDKYQPLVNLTRTQATAIQNLKLKHMKYKQVHSEVMMKLELTNEEVTYYEEKLTQEKLELKF